MNAHEQAAPARTPARGEKLAYSVEEATYVIGLGRTTLYELMDAGRLRYAKIGTRRVIRAEDARALIDAHMVAPEAKAGAAA